MSQTSTKKTKTSKAKKKSTAPRKPSVQKQIDTQREDFKSVLGCLDRFLDAISPTLLSDAADEAAALRGEISRIRDAD